jgi:chromosome segregation ATPase
MREVIREEIGTVNKRLDSLARGQDSLSKALEMQGGNIESLTEMLDDFGTRLADVEESGTATNQRLAKMRAKYQRLVVSRQSVPADQASEHSQDDHYQDAQAYDPSHPSDYQEVSTGTQQSTGLESPQSSMLP